MNIKRFITALIASTSLFATTLAFSASVATAAVVPNPVVVASLSKQAACSGLNQVDGDTNADCSNLKDSSNGIERVTRSIVDILGTIVGIVAIIMIIVAGLKFITSGGDANRAASARSTLTYALIGIAVAALAKILVKFVLGATSTPPPTP